LNDRASAWILAILLVALPALPALAAEDAALLKDLTSVIALLGLPCGQVDSETPLNDTDHVATSRDGNRYRVFVSAEGKVVGQKQ
jgi:hypothetical protein